MTWKWAKGIEALTQGSFGDPVNGTTGYRICLYDEISGTPTHLMGLSVAPGGTCATMPCWKPLADKGWLYKYAATNPYGVSKLTVKGGLAGKPVVKLLARSVQLAVPTPFSASQLFAENDEVIVQLSRDDASACWESRFAVSGTKANTVLSFKARAP